MRPVCNQYLPHYLCCISRHAVLQPGSFPPSPPKFPPALPGCYCSEDFCCRLVVVLLIGTTPNCHQQTLCHPATRSLATSSISLAVNWHKAPSLRSTLPQESSCWLILLQGAESERSLVPRSCCSLWPAASSPDSIGYARMRIGNGEASLGTTASLFLYP